MIPRTLELTVKMGARQSPVVAIVGPRQAGKTTLARLAFPKKPYASLEDADTRAFALTDPRGFLAQYPDGAILDEFQRAPELSSYLQTLVDERRREGLFILTGSHHFLLMERLAQSLAGRVSINKLLPLSFEELQRARQLPTTLNELLFHGGYPRLYEKHLTPTHWLADYVETYLERDVRLIKNVGDLSTFHKFIRMCAARSAQLLNLSELANDCGVTHNTAKAWLSVLETSFIVFLLPPHHRNFHKRLKKSPKLYFYDTGLLCHLLGLTKFQELETHAARGAIFETWVISELVKQRVHRHHPVNLFFWQDKLGREIDCIIDQGGHLTPIEIKAGQTVTDDYFTNLRYWSRLADVDPHSTYVVYAGLTSQSRPHGQVLSWTELYKLPKVPDPSRLRSKG